jgi:hypothetical protein
MPADGDQKRSNTLGVLLARHGMDGGLPISFGVCLLNKRGSIAFSVGFL